MILSHGKDHCRNRELLSVDNPPPIRAHPHPVGNVLFLSKTLHKSMSRIHSIDGITLHLGTPDASEGEWIGQREVLKQLLACWLVVDKRDLPLTPRLVGTPGIGKTTLAISGARQRGQDLYIYQCTADTRPEDLLITPVLAESGKIAYHASPMVTAMLTGGVCILDEGNRMNEKSWASLAPLLDHRRYVESIVAGITIAAVFCLNPPARRDFIPGRTTWKIRMPRSGATVSQESTFPFVWQTFPPAFPIWWPLMKFARASNLVIRAERGHSECREPT